MGERRGGVGEDLGREARGGRGGLTDVFVVEGDEGRRSVRRIVTDDGNVVVMLCGETSERDNVRLRVKIEGFDKMGEL